MQDDGLKRGIHFVCGVLLGAPLLGMAGYGVTRLIVKRWGDFPRAEEILVAFNTGLICAAIGGLIVGVLAMTYLDRFWNRLSEWFDE